MSIEWSNSPIIGAVLVLALVLLTPQVAKALATMAVVGGLLFGAAVWMGYAPAEVQTVVTKALQNMTQESGLCTHSPDAPVASQAAQVPAPAVPAPMGALARR